MQIAFTHNYFSSLSNKYINSAVKKTSYFDIFNFSLFQLQVCTFKVTMTDFADIFEDFYIFLGDNGPLPHIIFITLNSNTLFNRRLKFIEITEWLQN